MLGVGYQEIMVIALLALVIFGPGKLPEVMREAGKHYRKFKGMADEMTGELNKVTAEARKELDGAFGDLGPMGKDLEKSLGVGSKTRTTSTGTKSTTSSAASGARKSASSSSTAKKSSTAKSSTATKSTTTAGSTTKTSTKPVVANKEDPLADFATFEGEKKTTTRRSRSATPSSITDQTPREFFGDLTAEEPEKVAVDISKIEDPIARARARRRGAGYART